MVESWNAANAVIYYGKGGEISTNHREEAEMAALCLRILQASLVYVNTLMLQEVLTEPVWADRLTAADRRGLTPLFGAMSVPTERSAWTCNPACPSGTAVSRFPRPGGSGRAG
ncbi:Tn3 family transposase [Actinomadura viridis]|uniref:Tn3 family transposase n=1 Tax=Actinomadura viridis TaxID=58110 RepID=UPI003693FEE2